MKIEREKFWASLEEKNGDLSVTRETEKEFPFDLSGEDCSRRNFLKTVGFGIAGTMTACSRMPVEKSIPYLIQPDNIVPGKAYWYATTCNSCPSQCGIVAKTREGRPIKVEGNEGSEINQGGLCAKGQASVLDLYDKERLHGPQKSGHPIEWDILDEELLTGFDSIRKKRGRVRVLSETISSPTLSHVLSGFLRTFSNGKHVVYDAISYSGLIAAQRACFGVGSVPRYHFDRADLVVSFGADFLGTWLSPVEFSKDFATRRRGGASMSRHIQVESRMSPTGANADERIPLRTSDLHYAVAALLVELESLNGNTVRLKGIDGTDPTLRVKMKTIAKELHAKRKKSLVITSSNRKDVSILVARINYLLGNYGWTLDVTEPSHQREGLDSSLEAFLAEIKSGKIDAVIILGANPLYNLSIDADVIEAFKKTPLIVSLTSRVDETSRFAHYQAPDHHGLESWGDRQPVQGVYHLMQPVLNPVFRTRQAGESLLRWQKNSSSFLKVLKQVWKSKIAPAGKKGTAFELFWKQAVHDGTYVRSQTKRPKRIPFKRNVASDVATLIRNVDADRKTSGFELELYEPVSLGDGRAANNPWLLELADPITKVAWDNYASISVEDANRLNLKNGSLVSLASGDHKVDIPVYVQPGQAKGSMAVALGYGRTDVGKAGNGVGVNLYPWVSFESGERQYDRAGVTVRGTGGFEPLAMTQTHMSMEGRPIVHELTTKELEKGDNLPVTKDHDEVMLWESHRPEHRNWGMAIDLSACTGCSGCVVACQAENNIPVVGKEEVRNRREMSWIRIDRYYRGDEENPDVVFQPMLCQHCGNAPCESVCPVLATVHSSDGLNQQIYNRCIGTRYCANNCPYKVRRFNWFEYSKNEKFDYHLNNDVGRLVLNPDVVVRSRGVMEKCSLCVQRIQAGRLEAKKKGMPVRGDDIKTACQQSCPTDAITFGDLNDPTGKLSKLLAKDPRRYHVLSELNVKPGISYLAKVRNRG